MKSFWIAAFVAGLTAGLSGAAWAQPHPEPGHPAPAAHPGAVHPVPAMHVPTAHAAVHPPVSHVHVVHHYVRHHYHHHVVHHVTHVTHVTTTHISPRVAALRRNVVAAHRFHAGIYRAPPGYVYRRWSYGEALPAIYWGRDYWITDFLAFGLFAPPDGYIWVRYGPDALLIDEYTGEIIQVDYGVFY